MKNFKSRTKCAFIIVICLALYLLWRHDPWEYDDSEPARELQPVGAPDRAVDAKVYVPEAVHKKVHGKSSAKIVSIAPSTTTTSTTSTATSSTTTTTTLTTLTFTRRTITSTTTFISAAQELEELRTLPRVESLVDVDGKSSQIFEQSRPPLAFWTLFAGREEVLSLQIPYMQQLVNEKELDEVHMFNLTCKEKNEGKRFKNDVYVRSLLPIVPRSFLAQMGASRCKWLTVFQFYGDHAHPDDVIVKVDDDVLFVDTTRFAGFTEMIRWRKDVQMWSANIVNNGKAALLQMHNGALDEKLVSWRLEMCRTARGMMYRSKEQGVASHRAFIQNATKFFHVPNSSAVVYRVRCRISINFLAYRGAFAKDAYRLVLDALNDDEHALTFVLSVEKHWNLYMYMPLVVAHASFGPQRMFPEVAKMYAKGKHRLKNNLPWKLNVSEVVVPREPIIDFDKDGVGLTKQECPPMPTPWWKIKDPKLKEKARKEQR